MVRPPIKNPITAISDGSCKSLSPDIACPEVQPPAYRVPKPTKKPPMAKMRILLKSNNAAISKSSVGKYAFPALLNPSAFKSAIVSGLITTARSEVRKCQPI
jgi:hypothetical protein